MTEIPDHIKQLTNAELRNELLKIGITSAPLTPTTKKLYQKKLFLKLKANSPDKNEEKNFDKLESETNFKDDLITKEVKSESCYASCQQEIDISDKNVVTRCYVVSLPSENQKVASSIFNDKQAALKLLKNNKEARFYQFSSINKAQDFIQHEDKLQNNNKTQLINNEKTNQYSSPKQIELTELMHVIETNQLNKFNDLVWGNPRFLISSSDGPVPLKPSTRYNALHVAACSNQALMVKHILSTLNNLDFHALMYTGDDYDANRTRHLTDLYLNTPERGCFDTPLHIASKFGFTDVVAELLSHPLCDKLTKNKYGETPASIVCSRSGDASARDSISFLLDDHYYLPLIRFHDNTNPPSIGRPWTSSGQTPCEVNAVPFTPTDSVKVVSAIVGPMSEKEAVILRHQWSTPNKKEIQGRHAIDIRLSDLDKGEERVGRNIARQSGLQWLEYWDFLGEYTDLSTSEGLSLLETYFRDRSKYENSLLSPTNNLLNDLSREMTQLSIESNPKRTAHHVEPLSLPAPHSPELHPSSSLPTLHLAQVNLLKRALKCDRPSTLKSRSQLVAPSCVQPPCSPSHLDVCHAVSRSKTLPPVFIMGSHPTKLDRDVLHAIPPLVHPDQYPHVAKWMHSVLSYPEPDRIRWKTPRKISLKTDNFRFPVHHTTRPYANLSPISISFN